MGILGRLFGERKKKEVGDPWGFRTCALCRARWRTSYGAFKDMYPSIPGSVTNVSYDPANILGLTCTGCGKSFCKKCLEGRIPSMMPGGSCPLCGAELSIA